MYISKIHQYSKYRSKPDVMRRLCNGKYKNKTKSKEPLCAWVKARMLEWRGIRERPKKALGSIVIFCGGHKGEQEVGIQKFPAWVPG